MPETRDYVLLGHTRTAPSPMHFRVLVVVVPLHRGPRSVFPSCRRRGIRLRSFVRYGRRSTVDDTRTIVDTTNLTCKSRSMYEKVTTPPSRSVFRETVYPVTRLLLVIYLYSTLQFVVRGSGNSEKRRSHIMGG